MVGEIEYDEEPGDSASPEGRRDGYGGDPERTDRAGSRHGPGILIDALHRSHAEGEVVGGHEMFEGGRVKKCSRLFSSTVSVGAMGSLLPSVRRKRE